jgi:hypothetical protein
VRRFHSVRLRHAILLQNFHELLVIHALSYDGTGRFDDASEDFILKPFQVKEIIKLEEGHNYGYALMIGIHCI